MKYKNIFVLCTGRCGSVTFSKACQHIEGYTVGHESRAPVVGISRLYYPEYHIEVDNRLSWFLGELLDKYPEALYIHLMRNRSDCASSFAKRIGNNGILDFYIKGVLMRGNLDLKNMDYTKKLNFAFDYVSTITTNIYRALIDELDYRPFHLEAAKTEWEGLWHHCNFKGSYERSLVEWNTKYNASIRI